MDETSSLLHSKAHDATHWITVQIPAVGFRHFTGISSRYSNEYPAKLTHVVSSSEFVDVMDRLNETIADYWPCTTCYYFGYCCCPCTLGLSVFIPNYCASYSELYATAFLRNISLKARYFDRKISFTLVKSFCSSHIEIKFPASLLDEERNPAASDDLEGQPHIITSYTSHIHPSSANTDSSSTISGAASGGGEIDLSNIIITSVPSAAAFMSKERLKKS